MITIVKNNSIKEEDKIFQVACPYCNSEFKFQLEDLKVFERKPGGKRLIDCPCCGMCFNTITVAFECKGDGEVTPNQTRFKELIGDSPAKLKI